MKATWAASRKAAMPAWEIPSLGDKVFSATITEISWISTNMDVAQPLVLHGGTDRAQQPA